MYQIPKDMKKSTAEQKYADGIFLGLVDRSDEAVISTPGGVVKSRCIRRLPLDKRGDAAFFNSCKGTPWQPIPGGEEGQEVQATVMMERPVIIPAADLPAGVPRRTEEGIR